MEWWTWALISIATLIWIVAGMATAGFWAGAEGDDDEVTLVIVGIFWPAVAIIIAIAVLDRATTRAIKTLSPFSQKIGLTYIYKMGKQLGERMGRYY